MRLLLFTVDSIRCALEARHVLEIVRAVAVVPLPGSPAVVEGVIDVRGALVPVFDMRRRFGRAPRDVAPADHFVIVDAGDRVAALHVDTVSDLVEIDDAAVADPRAQTRAGDYIAGVAMLEDGLALIHDPAQFLSAAEREVLDALDSSPPTALGSSHSGR